MSAALAFGLSPHAAGAGWSRRRVRWAARWLRLRHPSGEVPLDTVLALRARMGSNRLDELTAARTTSAEQLDDPELRRALAGETLGTWSLDADTLAYLEREIASDPPRRILEFGSGVSTVCLAWFMRRHAAAAAPADEAPLVVAVEQDETFARRARELLAELDLAGHAVVLHAPLRRQTIEGVDTLCYDLEPQRLSRHTGAGGADFVVVDGPAAEGGARFGTLPLARPALAPGARFYLDDALRDEELFAARMWRQLEGIEPRAIRLVGKGLLVGRWVGSA